MSLVVLAGIKNELLIGRLYNLVEYLYKIERFIDVNIVVVVVAR